MSGINHATRCRATGLLLVAGLVVAAIPLSAVAAEGQAAEGETLYYDSREEIPSEYQWDLQAIYPDVESWESTLNAVEKALPTLAVYKDLVRASARTSADSPNRPL